VPLISDADEWRNAFVDGYATTVLQLDSAGRIRIYGFDGDDLIHCTSHSPDEAEQMADLLRGMAAHSRDQLRHMAAHSQDRS
jgi:hypothetical protein